MKRTWLVTGSNGFIAGRLLATAREGNLQGSAFQRPCIGIDIAHAAYDTEDISKIVHLGAISGIADCSADAERTFERNVYGSLRRMRQARQLGVPLVFASSAAAAAPTSFYAASKAMIEAWCEAHRQEIGQPISILRFANVYGPGSIRKTSVVATMCRDAIQQGVIHVHAPGDQCRDLVHVDDVIKAIDIAPDGLWGVRTGAFVTMVELAEHISQLSGAKICFTPSKVVGAKVPSDESPPVDIPYLDWRPGVLETLRYFEAELRLKG